MPDKSKAAEMVEIMKGKKLEVSLLSEDDSPCNVSEWLPTGCLALDVIMGGGIPVGRMTEIYGEPSSGKSLVATQIAAVAQEEGYVVVYVDTETAVSRSMMEKLGVKNDELIYASPDTVEEVFTFFDGAIETKRKIDPKGVMVLIWDSIAATSSRDEMTKDYGQIGYPMQARIISQSLRKITRKISKDRIAAVFLNQTRQKIGVLFGDNVATFGGMAVSFHASVRVALTLSSKIKIAAGKGKNIVGMNTRALVVKNKVAIPYRETMLPIYFGSGIDDAEASFNWLDTNGFITGTQWRHMNIGDEDIKFQKSGFEEVYEEHYEEISKLMLESIDDTFLTEVNEEEESAEEENG